MLPRVALVLLFVTGSIAAPAAAAVDDPWLWLEEIQGERALAWVREQNGQTLERLRRHPDFDTFLAEARRALDATSRVPVVTGHADWLYEFRQEAAQPRGVLRRTTLAQLRQADSAWETVLDLDALSKAEDERWAFRRLECLPRDPRHCLVFLSRGGDAVVMREFDALEKRFVVDGFDLPESKMQVAWRDADSLFVATDFGPGTMTTSGYPRVVRLWRRGTALAAAKTLFEAGATSMSARGLRLWSAGGPLDLVIEQRTFWTSTAHLLDGEERRALDLPPTAVLVGAFDGRLVLVLKEDWRVGGKAYPGGAVVIVDPRAASDDPARAVLIAAPDAARVIESAHVSDRGILVRMLDQVRGRLRLYAPAGEGWVDREIALPDNGAIEVDHVDRESGLAFIRYESFTTPPTLYALAPPDWRPESLKQQAPTFDGDRFEVAQRFAISADGTRVPYFMVSAKGMKLDGRNPTHIFSYGGFRNSLTPSYSGSYEPLQGAYGKLWLERGGVFVLANIRGGGEYGPSWHTSVLRHERHRTFEDFEAVADDLVRRGVTAPRGIGIEGRSQGGLLVAALMNRRPAFYGAVVCGVPLTDMKRYSKLLAGASWVAEYGDPDDPEDWAYLATYSPYHNVRKGEAYPPVFIYTATLDDRVHPGHARKLAARLLESGYEVNYYENTEGGHRGNATHEQLALRVALAYAHLWSALRRPDGS